MPIGEMGHWVQEAYVRIRVSSICGLFCLIFGGIVVSAASETPDVDFDRNTGISSVIEYLLKPWTPSGGFIFHRIHDQIEWRPEVRSALFL